MKTIQGRLKVVASTGGIKIEGFNGWINPSAATKKYMVDRIDDAKKLINKLIEVNLEENGEFTSFRLLDENADEPKKIIDRETLIIRQNAGTHADNYIKVLQELGYFKDKPISLIFDEYYSFAAAFEKWCYR